MIIKLKSELLGNHIHERVFVGPDEDHLALAGMLTFHVGEWQLFGAALLLGADCTKGHLRVITEGLKTEDELKALEDIS